MVDILQLHLAFHLPKDTAIVPVANFSDEELEWVEAAYPDLKVLLFKNKINNLLHVPFYLTYAVQLLHILKEETDMTESRFREIIWREVIEKGNKARGEVFENLAVKRAKEMSLYTQVEAPASLIEDLYKDHLILVEDDDLKDRYCPAHDILEDWALMRYVYRNKRSAGSPEAFFLSVGNELPIRRAFRLWIGEALQDAKPETIGFINDAIANTTIANHWKDELHISILRSDYSENFIAENAGRLLENKQALAYKFINMLKTACKESRKGSGVSPVTDLIGGGWGGMVKFVYAHRSEFDRIPYAIMAFLIDWGNKLYNGSTIDQEEGKTAGLLCLHLLETTAADPKSKFSFSGFPEQISRIVKLAFDLAGFIPDQVLGLLTTAKDYPRERGALSESSIREYYDKVLLLALDGTSCKELCKQFPKWIIQLFDDKVKPKNIAELAPRDRWGNAFERKVEFEFGLKYDFDYKCSPASALQTPAYWLLTAHPVKALRFFVGLLNYCINHYTASDAARQDEIVDVEITLNNGSKLIQTGSRILWHMYRGANGFTPSVLQSILMALEKWLFDLAGSGGDTCPRKMRQIYLLIYGKSRSVCPTAVMASVAMKFPEVVGDMALPLFTAKQILRWDAARALSDFPGSMFNNWGGKTVHDIDREYSNALPHRRIRNGIGRLMLLYQGEDKAIRERIWAILDDFRADPTTREEGYWQKLLTEIDSRKWTVERLPGDPAKGFLTPVYEGKAKKIVEEGQEELKRSGPEVAYLDWINNAIKNENNDKTQLGSFREALTYYREGKVSEPLFNRQGTLAVIGLRDFNGDLSVEERNWCIEAIVILLQHLILSREHWDYDMDGRKYHMQDVEPVLYFLPKLVVLSKGYPDKEARMKSIFFELILAPLHAHELSKLFRSVRKDLWRGDYDFAYQCFVLLLAYGALIDEKSGWRTGYGEPDTKRRTKDTDDLINKVLSDVHSVAVTIQLSPYRSGYYNKALTFVPANQNLEAFRRFAQGILELHLDFFQGRGRHERASEYYEDRTVISEFVPRILLGQPLSFGKAIVDDLYKRYQGSDEYPRILTTRSEKDKFIESIIQGFIYAANFSQDASEEGMQISTFWEYWRQIDDLNRSGSKQFFASELLLNINWSKNATEWAPLNGHAGYMKELIYHYGPNDLALAINLFASIGDKALMPEGISTLVRLYKSSFVAQSQLFGDNCIRLIQRAFYRHGRAIRGNKSLLDDFIFLLDRLTESGYSEAYVIREDMITFRAEN